MYWALLTQGVGRWRRRIWHAAVMRSGMLTFMLLALVLAGLAFGWREHRLGQFAQLKKELGKRPAREAPVRPGGQEPVQLQRSQIAGGNGRLNGAAGYLCKRVHTGISASRTLRQHLFARDAFKRCLQQALYGRESGLHLPAVEVEAIISQRNFQVAHYNSANLNRRCGNRRHLQMFVVKPDSSGLFDYTVGLHAASRIRLGAAGRRKNETDRLPPTYTVMTFAAFLSLFRVLHSQMLSTN